jgi:putative FmdB family regulatory protein
MPTYEYRCTRCDRTFEKFQGITEQRVKKCPRCGGRVERLIGAGAAVLFRGSGFYQTDYRSAEYQKKAKADTESSGPKPSSSTGDKPASSEPPKSD